MTVDAPLAVGHLFTIPAGELRWRFDTSGGPGGQHANRSATRAEVSFDLAASPSVPDHLRDRMLASLGTASGGVISVTVDDTRSQWRNRALARRRLAALLLDAAKTRRRRVATAPSAGGRRRRLERKRRRAEIKRLRRGPETDD